MIACTIPATAAEPKSEQGRQPWMQQGLALGLALGQALRPRRQLCPLQHAAEEMCVQLSGPLSVRAPSPGSGLQSAHPHARMVAQLRVRACGHGSNLQLEAVRSWALGVQSVRVWRHVFVHEALLGGSWLLVPSWLLRRDPGMMQEAEVEAELAAAEAHVRAAVQEAELDNVPKAAQRQLQPVVQHAELSGVQKHSLAAVQEAVLEAVDDYGQAAVQEAEVASLLQEGPCARDSAQAAVQNLVLLAEQNGGQEAVLGPAQAAVQEAELTTARDAVQKPALEAVQAVDQNSLQEQDLFGMRDDEACAQQKTPLGHWSVELPALHCVLQIACGVRQRPA